MVNSSLTVVEREMHDRPSLPEQYWREQSAAPRFLLQYSKNRHAACDDYGHYGVPFVGNRASGQRRQNRITVRVKRGSTFIAIEQQETECPYRSAALA
jgi:hypothetical protein